MLLGKYWLHLRKRAGFVMYMALEKAPEQFLSQRSMISRNLLDCPQGPIYEYTFSARASYWAALPTL